MSLRPRYSLLTLLVLTALVAGGLKLWYGPHRVVEWPRPEQEVEYTFTRDWHGKRILVGPYVTRSLNSDPQGWRWADIAYYRAGISFNRSYSLMLEEPPANTGPVDFSMLLDLSPEEQDAWRNAIEQERQRLASQGGVPSGAWFVTWLAE